MNITRGQWFVGIFAVLLIALLAFALYRAVSTAVSPEASSSSAISPSSPSSLISSPSALAKQVTVRYEITGPGAATMAYTNGQSHQVYMAPMQLPWSHEEPADASFMAADVSGAGADPHAMFGCKIFIDGKQVAGMLGAGGVHCKQGD